MSRILLLSLLLLLQSLRELDVGSKFNLRLVQSTDNDNVNDNATLR